MDTLLNVYRKYSKVKVSGNIDVLDVSTIMSCFGILYHMLTIVSKHRHNKLLLSKYVSTLHSILLCSGSVMYLSKHISPERWKRFQALPIGYLLYDLLLIRMIKDIRKSVGIDIYIHHMIFILFSSYYFSKDPKGVTLAYLSELSTPFINYYFYYRAEKNRKYTRFYGMIVFFLWPFCRLFNFSALTYRTLLHHGKVATTFAVGMTSLNFYWYYLMLRKIFRNRF